MTGQNRHLLAVLLAIVFFAVSPNLPARVDERAAELGASPLWQIDDDEERELLAALPEDDDADPDDDPPDGRRRG